MLSLKTNLFLLLLAMGYPLLMFIKEMSTKKKHVKVPGILDFSPLIIYVIFTLIAFWLGFSAANTDRGSAFLLDFEIESPYSQFPTQEALFKIETKLCIPFAKELIKENPEISEVGWMAFDQHFRLLVKSTGKSNSDNLYENICNIIEDGNFTNSNFLKNENYQINQNPLLIRTSSEFMLPERNEIPSHRIIFNQERLLRYNIDLQQAENALALTLSSRNLEFINSNNFENFNDINIQVNSIMYPLSAIAEIHNTSLLIKSRMYSIDEFNEMYLK